MPLALRQAIEVALSGLERETTTMQAMAADTKAQVVGKVFFCRGVLSDVFGFWPHGFFIASIGKATGGLLSRSEGVPLA
jgi:hypothetical protein